MTFPILGGNSAVATYSIDNSLRFNSGDNAHLSKTPSASNRDLYTISLWAKRSNLNTGARQVLFGVGNPATTGQVGFEIRFDNSVGDGKLRIGDYVSGVTDYVFLVTDAVFRDVSAWYHILYVYDSSQATNTDRTKLYVNGNQITNFSSSTYPNQNQDSAVGSNTKHLVGMIDGNAHPYNGYLAEINYIDGQALSPTDFGEFDEDSGIWKPIRYSGSYGTNGFYLDFENSGSLGADSSGNGNDFTPTNLASTDQTTDTPTNNFATMNPLILRTASSPTFSEGNCKVVQSASNGLAFSSISVSSGKWYVEVKVDAVGGLTACGIIKPSIYDNGNPDTQSITYQNSGNKKNLTTVTSYGASYTTGDIIGIAFDADNGTLIFYKNGVSQGTAFTGLDTTTDWIIGCLGYNGTASNNYGNPSFSISSGNSDGNGYGNFEYAPPSGYLALCTQNLATELSPTIDDGSQYFNTVLYTGDGTTNRTISGVGFQPDWTWLKRRSSAYSHALLDSNRGGGKVLGSDNTDAEFTNNNVLSSWNSDGFVIALSGVSAFSNTSGQTYVGWNWKANAGSTSSNTDGSITSTVQANTTAGFSIVTYSGNGSTGTVGHGLGAVPKLYIVKRRNDAGWSWYTYSVHKGAGYTLYLNSTSAGDVDTTVWQNTSPTSDVFYVGARDGVNGSGGNMVAYCFAEIEGYSKFGKYTGNGSTDGTFIYTGFKPAFVIIKRTDSSGQWTLIDTTRQNYNPSNDRRIHPNLSDGEYSGDGYGWDMLSNGFKQRSTSAEFNGSGASFIYLAIAESPFCTSTGIPVTAR
jgi:hypothetical protein